MRHISVFIIITLLVSCSKNKRDAQYFENYHQFSSFPEERYAEIQPLMHEGFNLPPFYFTLIFNNYLIFENSSNDKETMIQIYNINNGTIINKFGRQGQGEGEFLGIKFLNVDSNALGIYDVTLCRITYYTIDKLLSGFSKPDSMKKVSTDFGIPYFIQKIDSNRYVASGMFHPNRYAILDRNLNIISTHLPVPQKLLDLANNKYTYSFYHSGILYNDSLKRLAVGMKTYDMLQILNTDIEVIKSVHGPDHNFPDWTGKQKLSPEGYMPLTGSTHKIYGVYSGETPSTINDWIKSFGKNIHIFDWEGRPLKRIRTDYRIGNIVLSESQKRLYLVYYDEEYFRFGYIELLEDEL
jgi:hypothetical protein